MKTKKGVESCMHCTASTTQAANTKSTCRVSGAGQKSHRDFLVSRNSKTGRSINVDLSTCRPTKWCAAHCYGRRRTNMDPGGGGANNGPITWDRAQGAYRRNTEIVRWAADCGQLDELAAHIVDAVSGEYDGRDGRPILRGNGLGDLFPELCELYALIASKGCMLFIFSRIPEMIELLTEKCAEFEVTPEFWPFVLGSIDCSTPGDIRRALINATAEHNRMLYRGHKLRGPLAYACEGSASALEQLHRDGAAVESEGGYIRVVFGYHTNHKLTPLDCAGECPATAGQDTKCSACRMCYGPLR